MTVKELKMYKITTEEAGEGPNKGCEQIFESKTLYGGVVTIIAGQRRLLACRKYETLSSFPLHINDV